MAGGEVNGHEDAQRAQKENWRVKNSFVLSVPFRGEPSFRFNLK
jgi:hypothetical protein